MTATFKYQLKVAVILVRMRSMNIFSLQDARGFFAATYLFIKFVDGATTNKFLLGIKECH